MSDLDAKRQANIDAKEKARKEKNANIAAEKKAKAEARAADASAKTQAEEAKRKEREELALKRDANIKAREDKRREQEASNAGKEKKQQSKYSKKDVLELKAVFDEYDRDGDGKIELAEFTKALREKRDKSKPRPGQKSTLAERQASVGISIADLSEQTFHEMDTDGNGEVTFEELCKLFFRYATKDDMKVMMSYIAAPPEPEPEPEPTMTPEQVAEIKRMFKLYDKDKSGHIDKNELITALKATGLDRDEVKEMFDKADTSGDGKIDVQEFTKMMEETGAFYE